VDGAAITRADVARLAAARGVAPDATTPAFAGLVDELVDRKLLADQAVKDGLDRSPDGRRRLDAARDRVLSDLILEDRLRGAVTPEAVAGLYQEMQKAKPAGAPPETLEQARPRIVRFLTYDRVKDLVLDLRHRAKIEIVPQPAAAGSAKP
jgi:peptidyl-prolyl cis-trans isomerase C